MAEPQRCAVYRCFDDADVLLYVGCTTHPERRMSQHRRTADWIDRLATRTDEWYPSVQAALGGEYMAIVEERPRFNRRVLAPPAECIQAAVEAKLDAMGRLYYLIESVNSGRVFKMNRITGRGHPASREEATAFYALPEREAS